MWESRHRDLLVFKANKTAYERQFNDTVDQILQFASKRAVFKMYLSRFKTFKNSTIKTYASYAALSCLGDQTDTF